MKGKSLVLMFLTLRAKQMGHSVGFMNMVEEFKSYFDEAVQKFCGWNKIDILDKETFINYLHRKRSAGKIPVDEDVLTNTMLALARKYDCIFIDEITLECYHSV